MGRAVHVEIDKKYKYTDRNMKQQKIQLSQLEGLLKGVADDLRGKMDVADYKEYIMGMLFLKRMSDGRSSSDIRPSKRLATTQRQ